MSYEEREKQICRECTEKEICPYIPRKMEYKCQHLSDMMYGWELGRRDAAEKAQEWIERFSYNSVITDNIGEPEKQAIVTTFREYMEEQRYK